MEQVRIAILDAYDNVCAFLDNGAPKGLHYYEDELHEYLKGAANTFSFKSSAKHEDSAYLTEGNKLAFQYHDRDYYLNIMRVVRDEWTVEVIAYSLSFELLNEQKEAYKASKAMSFEEYLNVMDYEKVLTLKINEVSDKKITHEWTGTDTLLKRVYSLATVFGAEVEFIPELNRDHSLKRILLNVYEEHSDTAQGIGQERTDLTLYYGLNVTGITKTSDITELYTAIRPFGKDGLTVTNLDKTELDADGNIEFQSPKGNRNILAVQARDRFPSNPLGDLNDRYIAKVWEYDTDNAEVLYGQALAQLKKNCVPQVEYEVSGYFDTGIGDTVTIVDEEYTPELYLSARVTEQIVSFTDRTRNQTIFSNFKELQSEIAPELLARMNALIESNKVYSCIISTDNGIMFKNGEGSTTLTATVRDGGADKTEDFSIVWYKDGTELATGVSVTVNAADVTGKAVYRFEAKDSSGNVRGFCEATVVGVADGSDGKDVSADISSIQDSLSKTLEDLEQAKNDITTASDLATKTEQLVDDLDKRTAYVVSGTDNNGNPYLELGRREIPDGEDDFKVRITNTKTEFLQNGDPVAYISNHVLYIQSAVITNDFKLGDKIGLVWEKHGDGNWGARWFG